MSKPVQEAREIAFKAGHRMTIWQAGKCAELAASGMVNPADLWAAVSRQLLNGRTGEPVNVGDKVTSFRGEECTITGWPHDGRNRVWIKDSEGREAELFPSVFELVWKD